MSSGGDGRRRRRRMPKPKETSFLEHMHTDHGALAQERVIRDLRAAVRSVETERPYTPADRSRGLFGASRVGEGQHSRIGSASSVQGAMDLRPPSAFAIGRKQFLANLPETEDLERPMTGVRPSTRRNPPSVARTSAANEEPRRRCMSTSSSLSSAGRTRSSSRRRLPSGSDEHGDANDPDIPAAKQSSQRRMMPRPPPRRPPAAMDTTAEEHTSASTPTSALSRSASSSMKVINHTTTTPAGANAPPPPSSSSSASASSQQRTRPRPPTREGTAAGRRATSADTQPRLASAVVVDNSRWQELEPLLTKLSVEEPIDSLLDLVATISKLLNNKPLYNGQRNSELLRSLYRLTDLSDPRLLARVGRLILMITRKGTVKNVCKMLFKLSRNEANDALLQQEKIPDVLVGVLEVCNRQEHVEGLVYCCGAIKNLSSSADAQAYFVERGVLPVMNRHLLDIIQNLPPAGTQMSSYTGHLLVQMTAALRNLAVNTAHLPAFEESGLVQSLCALLELFPSDKDLVLNIMRIFSKVTMTQQGRGAIAQVANAVASIAKLAERHGGRKALCVRIYFVLGNLTAEDAELRSELFEATRRGHTLLDTLSRRGKELVAVLGAESRRNNAMDNGSDGDDEDDDAAQQQNGGGGHDDDDDDDDEEGKPPAPPNSNTANSKKTSDLEDLVIKLVRVIANLCISPEFGAHLAGDGRLSLLLDVCRTDAVTAGHHDLLMNIVGCVNNLSFYHLDDNFVLVHRLDFAQTLAPCLLSQNMDLVVEVARVFGNFSQAKEIRQLLVDNRVDELLVVLLEHTNRDVVYSVCGILMNLLGDQDCRHVMQKNDYSGIDSLIDVVAGTAGQDWQLAGLACKTLWNYAERLGQADGRELMAREQMEDLVDVLANLIADDAVPKDEASREAYEHEFAGVARHLHRHVSDCLNPMEPL
ncbi:hypothetical protein PTSG_04795 [Salpingoeca rosetta]|uniref:Armadillo repeat-containing protein 2 n=1 Tax=Salpingoeca rosetta (strain ATCC 50818 / BSB-021) TaxID=946362 RepID=F2U9Q3_SALR5|nr:uncharacterized protein PTSG_04795 [Salpingoeca rosetta]EGD73080.1 hypothetical protein PTSG_04795 [Salpingoeca rosetta]|eukprot:XP_004994111.1 hypothetical protein PTSG_04795 [Salpingoeca rosetta]